MTSSSVKQQRVPSMRYHDDFDHEHPVIGVNDLLSRKLYSLDGIKFMRRVLSRLTRGIFSWNTLICNAYIQLVQPQSQCFQQQVELQALLIQVSCLASILFILSSGCVSLSDAILSAQCPSAVIPLAQPYALNHGDHADMFTYSSRNPKC